MQVKELVALLEKEDANAEVFIPYDPYDKLPHLEPRPAGISVCKLASVRDGLFTEEHTFDAARDYATSDSVEAVCLWPITYD